MPRISGLLQLLHKIMNLHLLLILHQSSAVLSKSMITRQEKGHHEYVCFPTFDGFQQEKALKFFRIIVIIGRIPGILMPGPINIGSFI